MQHSSYILLKTFLFFLFFSFLPGIHAGEDNFADNKDETVVYRKILEYYRNRNIFETHRLAQQFIKLFPGSIRNAEILYLLGETDENFYSSITHLKKAAEKYPSSFWALKSRLAIALKFYTIGNYQRSEQELKIFINDFPDSREIVEAFFYRALSLQQLKNYKEAEKYFTMIFQGHPKHKFAYESKFHFGKLKMHQQKYKDAIATFSSLSNKNPKNQPALLEQLAIAYLKSGHKTRGRVLLDELIAKYPQSDSASRARRIILE